MTVMAAVLTLSRNQVSFSGCVVFSPHVSPACRLRYAHGCSAATQWPLNRGGGAKQEVSGMSRRPAADVCHSSALTAVHVEAHAPAAVHGRRKRVGVN